MQSSSMSGVEADNQEVNVKVNQMKEEEIKENRRGKIIRAVPVKLFIQGRNLKDLDMFSKSDPVCIVFEKAQDHDEWFEIGRTEYIKDNLNPDFQKCIDVDFCFEKQQQLKFEFIDDDGGDSDDPYYDIIGSAIINLSQIMSSRGQTVSKPLLASSSSKQRGMVIVRAESVKESNNQVCFQLVTSKLIAKTPGCIPCFSFSGQTCYEIQRSTSQDMTTFTRCFRSETREGSQNIKFKKQKI